MISNQILQSTIDGLKNIIRRELSVAEREGKIVATTEESMVNTVIENAYLYKVQLKTSWYRDTSILRFLIMVLLNTLL